MRIFLLDQTVLLSCAGVWEFLLLGLLLAENRLCLLLGGLLLLLGSLLTKNWLCHLGLRLRCGRHRCFELWLLSESCGSSLLLLLLWLRSWLLEGKFRLHLLLLWSAEHWNARLWFGLQAEVWSRLISHRALWGEIWDYFLLLLAAKHGLGRGKGIRSRHWYFFVNFQLIDYCAMYI